jgi:acyl-CoA dehydrogenase
LPTAPTEPLARLQDAFQLAFRADDVARKIKAAMKNGRLPRGKVEAVIDQALVEGVLTPEEAEVITRADQVRREVCQVDAFTREEYFGTGKRGSRAHEPQTVG